MSHQKSHRPAVETASPSTELGPLPVFEHAWGNQERLAATGLRSSNRDRPDPFAGSLGQDPVSQALASCFGPGVWDVDFESGTEPQAARLGADAFTIGSQVNLGGAVPALDDLDAVELLAHETAHALAGGGSGEELLSRSGDAGEARANASGAAFRRFVAGGRVGPAPHLGPATGGGAAVHRDGPAKKPTDAEYLAAGSEFSETATDAKVQALQHVMDITRASTEMARQAAAGETVDFERALDHEKAKHELAGKFEVVPDGYGGERKANTLTETEFRKTAGLYSDIRRDQTDLKFGGDGDEEATKNFKKAGMADIATILQTEEGRTVVGGLAENKDDHQTLIQRSATPNSPMTSAYGSGDLHELNRNVKNEVGTHALVQYTPGHAFDKNVKEEWAKGTRSDVLLYHELLHARQYTGGTAFGGGDLVGKEHPSHGTVMPVAPGDEGVSLDDYAAVGLSYLWMKDANGKRITENQYRASRANVGKGAVAGDGSIQQRDQYNYTMP